ncbi:hypothetical protein FB446DRAFT_741387 [Lentinula raphanica]|nr:hypothetical protein FB446DRAFT_741387 [Lentinula raphanica]
MKLEVGIVVVFVVLFFIPFAASWTSSYTQVHSTRNNLSRFHPMSLRVVYAILLTFNIVVMTCNALPLPLKWPSSLSKSTQPSLPVTFYISFSKEKPPLTPTAPLEYVPLTDTHAREEVTKFLLNPAALDALSVQLPNNIHPESPDYAKEVAKLVKLEFNKFPFAALRTGELYNGDAFMFTLYGAEVCTYWSRCKATVGESQARGVYGTIEKGSAKSKIYEYQEKKLTY